MSESTVSTDRKIPQILSLRRSVLEDLQNTVPKGSWSEFVENSLREALKRRKEQVVAR